MTTNYAQKGNALSPDGNLVVYWSMLVAKIRGYATEFSGNNDLQNQGLFEKSKAQETVELVKITSSSKDTGSTQQSHLFITSSQEIT